jgi:uncharacterized membrane protein
MGDRRNTLLANGRGYHCVMEPQARPEESAAGADATALPPHISQNIADIVRLHQQETASLSRAQRRLEQFGSFIARPVYFIAVFVLVGAWICFNLDAKRMGVVEFDPPPFAWLQGFLTFVALVTATVVLVGQRRQMKQSEQHAHLDLQVNLLTEQKVTKLIHMLEDLRHELPVTQRPSDAHTSALKQGINATQVATVLKQTDLGTRAGSPPSQPQPG